MSRTAFGSGFLLGKDHRKPPETRRVTAKPKPSNANSSGQGMNAMKSASDSAANGRYQHQATHLDISAIENVDYYSVLGISAAATNQEIKAAFRSQALQHHPDRTMDTKNHSDFTQAVKAFQVLSNTQLRLVYDEARKQNRLEVGRQTINASRQLPEEFPDVRPDALVITCEICRRMACAKCGVCQIDICAFCKFKPHSTPGFRRHWPFVQSSKFSLKIAKLQAEREEKERIKIMWHGNDEAVRKKKQESFLKIVQEFRPVKAIDDDYDNEFDDDVVGDESIRAMKTDNSNNNSSTALISTMPDNTDEFHPELAMFYAWAQSPTSVAIAIWMPAAETDKKIVIDVSNSNRLIVKQESLLETPIVDRVMANEVDSQECGLYSMDTMQNAVIVIQKTGNWQRLFLGDSDMLREVLPSGRKKPYEIRQNEVGFINVIFEVPYKTSLSEVQVDVDVQCLTVKVTGGCFIRRHLREDFRATRTDSSWRIFDRPGPAEQNTHEGSPTTDSGGEMSPTTNCGGEDDVLVDVVPSPISETKTPPSSSLSLSSSTTANICSSSILVVTLAASQRRETRFGSEYFPTMALEADSVPQQVFVEDADPYMVMAAASACMFMEEGENYCKRTELSKEAENYLGIMDGTATPPPVQGPWKEPTIDYEKPFPWEQSKAHAVINIPLPKEEKVKDVIVTIRTHRLSVSFGEYKWRVFDKDLCGAVIVDESYWALDGNDSVISVHLQKIVEEEWKTFFKN